MLFFTAILIACLCPSILGFLHSLVVLEKELGFVFELSTLLLYSSSVSILETSKVCLRLMS